MTAAVVQRLIKARTLDSQFQVHSLTRADLALSPDDREVISDSSMISETSNALMYPPRSSVETKLLRAKSLSQKYDSLLDGKAS